MINGGILIRTTGTDREPFPTNLFLIYVIFYAAQAMYNTYCNLFLTASGFSMSKIGAVQSIATIILVLIQPLWGVLSDKSKSKNTVIAFLIVMTALSCLGFYLSHLALWLAVCITLFSVFFYPAMTLQDNYTLEYLEKSKWDFGNIRIGGTIGYACCAALVGIIIKDDYAHIFWIMAVLFLITGGLYGFTPRVEGHRRKKEKVNYLILLKDRPLMCMLFFNVTYFLGTAFYFQFYPIYFKEELGATSQMVGILSFTTAMSEIPFFWYADKIEKKFGDEKVMIFAGIATVLRWLLLFWVTNPYLVFVINLLSGCGYVGFMYCLIKYINNHVPKSMKATAQSLNSIVGTIFSRIIFAPLGGVLGDIFGVRIMLLTAGICMLIGLIVFVLAMKPAIRYQAAHPLVDENGNPIL